MTWQWQATCSACAFVSSQLGFHTACPFHAGRWSTSTLAEDHGEPRASLRPTADQPWPFTVHEYTRLLVLRSRVQEQHQGTSRGEAAVGQPAAQWSDEQPALARTSRPAHAIGHPQAAWACPDWLPPYLDLLTGLRHESVEDLTSDCTADVESDPARARRVDLARAQVRLLETLHARALLRPVSDGQEAVDRA
jgi:hypothetical protein